jgi:hypothetical protein
MICSVVEVGYLLAFCAALSASSATITRLHAASRALPKIPAARIASTSACADWSSALRESISDWLFIRVQKYGAPHKYATKKKRQAKKSVCLGACLVLGRCTRGEPVGACCGVRACVRVAGESAGEYPTSLVGIWMRSGPHATRDDRARQRQPRSSCRQPRFAPLVDRQSTLADHQTDHPDSAGLDDPCKRLRLSTLAITVCNTRHLEWGFTL